MIVSFRRDPHRVRGDQTGLQQFPYFGRLRPRNRQPERDVEFGQQCLVRPHRVASGDGGTCGVGALGLPPLVAHHVVSELRTAEGRRRRQTLDQVRQILRGDIRLHSLLLCPKVHRRQQSDRCDEKQSFHFRSIFDKIVHHTDGVMNTRQEPSSVPRSIYFFSISWLTNFFTADMLMLRCRCISSNVRTGSDIIRTSSLL